TRSPAHPLARIDVEVPRVAVVEHEGHPELPVQYVPRHEVDAGVRRAHHQVDGLSRVDIQRGASEWFRPDGVVVLRETDPSAKAAQEVPEEGGEHMQTRPAAQVGFASLRVERDANDLD